MSTSTLAAIAREASASVPVVPLVIAETSPDDSAPGVQMPAADAVQALPPAVDAAAMRAEGASAERQRIKAIISSPEAEGREPLARHLAFETGMDAASASGALAACPKSSGSGRSLTGATVPSPVVASVDPAASAPGPKERLAAACAAHAARAAGKS
jgi:hypothetical protein